MNVKRNVADSPVRRVDDALKIIDLFDGEGFAFDFVIAELDGVHPTVVNRASDRAYFILNGEGKVRLGDIEHVVREGDLITIKAGTTHSITGRIRYAIVTAPPFDPRNEDVL